MAFIKFRKNVEIRNFKIVYFAEQELNFFLGEVFPVSYYNLRDQNLGSSTENNDLFFGKFFVCLSVPKKLMETFIFIPGYLFP